METILPPKYADLITDEVVNRGSAVGLSPPGAGIPTRQYGNPTAGLGHTTFDGRISLLWWGRFFASEVVPSEPSSLI